MKLEMPECDKHEVYEEAATGARPADCRWKAINQVDSQNRDARARLIAREKGGQAWIGDGLRRRTASAG
eukprot:5745890-Pyramimonas_sp.AAC.1